jgi:nitrogenase molybdenum-iron protein alpha chain
VCISDLIKEGFEVPYVNASFFGIEQTAKALRDVAEFFGSKEMKQRAKQIVEHELKVISSAIDFYGERLTDILRAAYKECGTNVKKRRKKEALFCVIRCW